MQVTIIGCGWLGLPLAKSLNSLNFLVHGSTTSKTKLDILRENGIQPFLFSDEHSQLPNDVFDSDVAVVCIPPSKSSDYIGLLKNLIQQFSNKTHFIFTSSTSVYEGTGEMNETSTIFQNSKMALAECCFKELQSRTTIIRLAGLIGNGRHPGRFLSGKEIEHGGIPVNLIHLEDVISALLQVIQAPKADMFNLCYPDHPTKMDYYTRKAKDIHCEPPIFLSNAGDGKRIDGSKFTVEYPFQYNHKI